MAEQQRYYSAHAVDFSKSANAKFTSVLADWPWALTTSTLDSSAACICPILIWAMTDVTPTWINTTCMRKHQIKMHFYSRRFGCILKNKVTEDCPSLNKMKCIHEKPLCYVIKTIYCYTIYTIYIKQYLMKLSHLTFKRMQTFRKQLEL